MGCDEFEKLSASSEECNRLYDCDPNAEVSRYRQFQDGKNVYAGREEQVFEHTESGLSTPQDCSSSSSRLYNTLKIVELTSKLRSELKDLILSGQLDLSPDKQSELL